MSEWLEYGWDGILLFLELHFRIHPEGKAELKWPDCRKNTIAHKIIIKHLKFTATWKKGLWVSIIETNRWEWQNDCDIAPCSIKWARKCHEGIFNMRWDHINMTTCRATQKASLVSQSTNNYKDFKFQIKLIFCH